MKTQLKQTLNVLFTLAVVALGSNATVSSQEIQLTTIFDGLIQLRESVTHEEMNGRHKYTRGKLIVEVGNGLEVRLPFYRVQTPAGDGATLIDLIDKRQKIFVIRSPQARDMISKVMLFVVELEASRVNDSVSPDIVWVDSLRINDERSKMKPGVDDSTQE